MKKNTLWVCLIGGLALLCLIALLFIQFFKQDGVQVCIYQNGILLETLPLDQDCTRTFTAPNGGYNTVVIQNGTVQVTKASCSDQVCVRHGPTHETADPIVCLPNQLVVQVISDKEDALDGVSQ